MAVELVINPLTGLWDVVNKDTGSTVNNLMKVTIINGVIQRTTELKQIKENEVCNLEKVTNG